MSTVEPFVKLFNDKNYKWFDSGSFNLNIFSIRCNKSVTNKFDDYLFCIFRDNSNKWVIKQWAVTTDPGLSSLKNPMNPKGTAILAPGQYQSSHKIGLHRGKYKALVQHRPVTVYRDNNKDSKYDLEPTKKDTGIFGINIHKAGQDSTWVDDWSAGCQVFKRSRDFDEFMGLVTKSAKLYGDIFTYTLFDDYCDNLKV